MNKNLMIPITVIVIIIISVIISIFGSENMYKLDNKYEKYLDVKLDSVTLIIKNGNEFKAESDYENVIIKKENNKLLIREKKSLIMNKMRKFVYVYIPEDIILDYASIQMNGGLVKIENLNANKLEIETESGSVKIDNLIVNNDCEIESARGKIEIEGSIINNLELDIINGSANINSLLTGKNEIDLTSGIINLNLIGDDYKFNTDEVSGTIKINNEREIVNNNGNTIIEIENVSGSVNVLTNR